MTCRQLMYAGLVTVFASTLTVTMSACKKKETSGTGDMAYGQTVRGKVTFFNGEPVPYGYVLLFHMQNSIDAKSGRLAATCFGEIKGGKYLIADAPTGVMKVVVATDPDVDQMALLKPEVLGTPPGGLIGKKSGGGPDKGPGGKGGPPGGPDGGPEVKPPGFKMPVFNPAAEKLTDAEKDMCKEIHKLYGKFDISDILYPVKEGDQTFDITMTSAKKK
jgi:hypothetical protein